MQASHHLHSTCDGTWWQIYFKISLKSDSIRSLSFCCLYTAAKVGSSGLEALLGRQTHFIIPVLCFYEKHSNTRPSQRPLGADVDYYYYKLGCGPR